MAAPRLDAFDRVFGALSEHGVAIWESPLSSAIAEVVRGEVAQLAATDHFRPAMVGRGPRKRRIPEVRADRLCWLVPSEDEDDHELFAVRPGLRALRAFVDDVRRGLSERARTSLPTVEMMATHYPPGTFYKAHIDQFVGGTERVFTFVYFLNPGWRPPDGGLLTIRRPGAQEIEPRLGRFVLFHTPEVLHEVTVTQRDRYAITGWLGRTRPR